MFLSGFALAVFLLFVVYAARRVLAMLVRFVAGLAVLWLAYNATTLLNVELPNAGWQPGFALGAAVGFVIVGVLAFRLIFNALVEADRGRAHQGVDKTHDGRRI